MASATAGFKAFVREAEAAVLTSPVQLLQTADKEPLLNGIPYRVFRQTVDLGERRSTGAFFSGTHVATQLAKILVERTQQTSIVMDPTCGMGDLLLGYANSLPVSSCLEATLKHWGRVLMGIDQQPELVRLSKLRLAMLARYKGRFLEQLSDIDAFFPHIVVGDMFENKEALRTADAFLFNPPFGQAAHPYSGEWTSGLVNAAAVFLDFLIQAKKPEAPIAAILPEVLRCGTRYSRFRSHIEDMGVTGTYTSLGQFDSWADVDVFATLLYSSNQAKVWRRTSVSTASQFIEDFFVVRVGPVVPHRHAHRGPWRKYICARTIPAWSEGYEPQTSRRFKGTVFEPPFVVVRRTSSPGDRERAKGSVVIGDRTVAVENHLLVLKPKDANITTCHKLIKILHRQETTDHLNETIRCRHLTTSAVAKIPWNLTDG